MRKNHFSRLDWSYVAKMKTKLEDGKGGRGKMKNSRDLQYPSHKFRKKKKKTIKKMNDVCYNK